MTSLQNLFVTKLPRNITDVHLQQVFAEFRPTSAKVMLDAASGKSKGFGFVLFDSIENGTKAFDAMNHKHVNVNGHGFTLNIFPSKHDGKTASMESNALYIRNIPTSMSKQGVEQFLSNFGTMIYCAMREDHYGNPVWVVYVEYDCVDCAKTTLKALHGSTSYFTNAPAPILAKFADCDEAKRERRRRREETRQTAVKGTDSKGGDAAADEVQAAAAEAAAPAVAAAPPVQHHHSVPASPLPGVSMFTPAPVVDREEIIAGKTIHANPLSGHADSHDVSFRSDSYSWASMSSMYRHNPYGGTFAQVRTPVVDRANDSGNASPENHII
jgi:RNA recognition motif-containing protein